MVLGDNPSVSSGAPIMLGWENQGELHLCIDVYERFYRRPRKVVRRRERRSRREDLAIPSVQQRTKHLIQSGYCIYEIAEAALEVIRVKKEKRAETLERTNWERVDEFIESASRALRTVVDTKPSFVGAKRA
jgi:hypothetical protein